MLKRLLFFAYGAACYLIFLATFLYAIAFVGGFAVPTRLDDDPHGAFGAALLIDCTLLTLFAVQHSVMARRWFKARWTQIVPWTAHIVLAIQFEERDLVAEHGAAYEEYRRSVPMLLPWARGRSAMQRPTTTTPAETVRASRA